MARQTYYVLQEFEIRQKRWTPKAPREVAGRELAVRIAERLRSQNLPVLAFARTGDLTTGEFDDAELIAAFNVPPEFMGESADV